MRANEETKAINAAYELLDDWDWRDILYPQPQPAPAPVAMLGTTASVAQSKPSVAPWIVSTVLAIALACGSYRYWIDKTSLEAEKRNLVGTIESVRKETEATKADLSGKIAKADVEKAELRRKLQEAIDNPRTVLVEAPQVPDAQNASASHTVSTSDDSGPVEGAPADDGGTVVRRGDPGEKVRRVFGKPRSVDAIGDTKEIWWYEDLKRVELDDGVVESWHDMGIEP